MSHLKNSQDMAACSSSSSPIQLGGVSKGKPSVHCGDVSYELQKAPKLKFVSTIGKYMSDEYRIDPYTYITKTSSHFITIDYIDTSEHIHVQNRSIARRTDLSAEYC